MMAYAKDIANSAVAAPMATNVVSPEKAEE